jgi:hypothetical protein
MEMADDLSRPECIVMDCTSIGTTPQQHDEEGLADDP